jgi:endonuclease-3
MTIQAKRLLTAREIEEIFKIFSVANPKPKGELIYQNPYTLLIAVVLSAQSTDKSVNKATSALFAVASNPEAMVALGEEKLREYIKTIGLYNSKARNILLLSQKLLTDFQGKVPANRQQLEELPGVGRKTANVVLNIVFGEPTIAVDTHVFRVANRTGLALAATPSLVEKMLGERVPHAYQQSTHHWLILHGRYVCKARKPGCQHCCIKDICEYPEKTAS